MLSSFIAVAMDASAVLKCCALVSFGATDEWWKSGKLTYIKATLTLFRLGGGGGGLLMPAPTLISSQFQTI